MPLYDYQCTNCKKITEVRHGFDEVHTAACEACGGKLKRVFNAAPIVFKGSGFYINDSRPKSSGTGDTSTTGTSAADTSISTPSSAPSGNEKKSDSSTTTTPSSTPPSSPPTKESAA